jgi:glycosyltransferase involved in cell wall biosynthesis
MAKIAVTGFRGVPATWGGVEHHCEELYSRLAANGHDITIYARSFYVKSDIKFYKGMKIIRLPTIGVIGLEAFVHTFLSMLHILKTRPDIVHIHAQGPCLLSWAPRLFRPDMRVFFTCHGLDWKAKKFSKFASSIVHLGEVFSAMFPHYRITVSKELQRYYETCYGVQACYIPSGASKMEKRPPNFIRSYGLSGKDYFLFVGRLVPEKRVEDIVKAFLQKERKSRLVIVGDSASTDNYVASLRRMSASHASVVFAGYQYGNNLEEFFSNARAFVNASEREGLPLTILEALSYGLPCIASDIPPHREILVYQPDLIFPTGQLEALSNLMELLDEMPEAGLADVGKRAMAILDRDFNWDDIARATERLYQESLTCIPP